MGKDVEKFLSHLGSVCLRSFSKRRCLDGPPLAVDRDDPPAMGLVFPQVTDHRGEPHPTSHYLTSLGRQDGTSSGAQDHFHFWYQL